MVATRARGDEPARRGSCAGWAGAAACGLPGIPPPAGPGPGGGGGGRGTARWGPPISTFKKGQVGRCEPTLKIPATARVTEPYWHRADDAGRYTFDEDAPFGLPHRPTPFYVQVTLALPGGAGIEEVIDGMPVQY